MGPDGKNKIHSEPLSAKDVGTWLRDRFESSKGGTNVWLDIVGYDKATFNDLASVLCVEESLLSESLVFK
jgi:hypothetical protein